MKTIPLLLDLFTVFCLGGGCLFLWLNLRSRGPVVIISPTREADVPLAPAAGVVESWQEQIEVGPPQQTHPIASLPIDDDQFFDQLRQHLSDSEAAGPEAAADQNPYANHVARGLAKIKNSKVA